MSLTERWLLAIGLVVVDLMIFFIPLTGLVGAYIVIVRPQWFRDWVDGLFASS